MLLTLDLTKAVKADSIEVIVKGLSESAVRLERLVLRDNQLPSQSAILLAEYLQNVDSIVELNVSANNFDSEGMQLLSASLEPSAKSGQLKKLFYAHNWIDRDAMNRFC